MTRNDEWARVNAHVTTFTGRTEEDYRKIVRQDRGFQLGFEPVSSCTRSTNSGQYIAVFVQLCLGAHFMCYLIMARWLVTSHETSCKFLTETSRMHAGSCDLVTRVEKWLHQNAGSANQCELLHFCTVPLHNLPDLGSCEVRSINPAPFKYR